MDISHFQLIGAVLGAAVSAGWAAWRAASASRRVEQQVQPNGDGETRTIRQMITELLHMNNRLADQNNRLADQMREHDEMDRRIQAHLAVVESKLDEHLDWETKGRP